MDTLFIDLQETFYILFGPYIVYVVLPLWGGIGIVLAVLLAVQNFWRPLSRIRVIFSSQDDTS